MIGSSDDGAHSQNEKINIKNYIEGVNKYFVSIIWMQLKLFNVFDLKIKLLGTYLQEVAEI